MARRSRQGLDAFRREAEVEAEYLKFRETQLGRLCTASSRGEPRFIRDWPTEAQERFVENQLAARARWAGKDDWVHAWLKSNQRRAKDR